ncbi:MAG TPA: hypothetical protein PLV45_08610, partial [bacterium]|nr:hypothetical protein [bacterium]
GMDSLECPVQDIPEMGSAMSRLLAYLEIYQTAESILSRLMDQGRSELREEYACLLFEMYIVYHNTDDRSGAVECLDRLSDLLEEMIREKPGDWVLENRLGVTRMEKAGLIQLESPEEALALLETIIPVFQGLQGCPDPVKILENLSRAYTVAANATTRKGDKAGALELFNAAEDVVFRKMKITGQTADMDHVLILMNRAGLDSDRSRRLIQKDYLDVLKILNRVDPAETSQDHLGFKVVTTIGYAETLIDEGKYKEALALVEAACRLVEDIIQRDGWRDLLEERGGLRVNAAECLIGMGRLDDADRSVETAIAALETQYFMHDNSRGIHFLGQAYRVKARILHRRGRTDDALMFLDEAETILENARTERDQAYLDRHIQMVKNLRSVIRNDSGE